MVHQDELEHELVIALEPRATEVISNDYMVFGTVDKKFWRKGLKSSGHDMADLLAHAADFKEELNLEYDPGGWRPDPEKV